MSTTKQQSTKQDAVTIALSKKESEENLVGMKELRALMQHQKPIQITARLISDDEDVSLKKGDDDEGKVLKIVHFVRHGQGFHNLMADLAKSRGVDWVQFSHTPENPYIMPEVSDSPLTEKGRQQAHLLQSKVKSLRHKPELIILSPLCRALQTGLIVFEEFLPPLDQNNAASSSTTSSSSSSIPFIAHEQVREEHGIHVCDRRRRTSRQKREFPQVDFSLLDDEEEDPLFRSNYRESRMELGERIYEFLVDFVMKRDESVMGIASHSGWLFTLFNGVCDCGNDEKLKRWFQTGEMKSVKLVFKERR